MNAYTVEYQYASAHVEASDSDMACINAAAELDHLSVEDRGELRKVTLHGASDMILMDRDAEDLNAGWEAANTVTLPPRRARGLTLSYYGCGDLFVQRLGYSASLLAASNEGELHPHNPMRDSIELSPADMQVVDGWMAHYDEYFEQNGWATQSA